mgnify:CR=1 FL=1
MVKLVAVPATLLAFSFVNVGAQSLAPTVLATSGATLQAGGIQFESYLPFIPRIGSNLRIGVDGVNAKWTTQQVASIVVNVRNGNDVVTLYSLTENITVNSGKGNDRVHLVDGLIDRLGGEVGPALGVGVQRFRIGGDELTVYKDAWGVDVAGPEPLVRRVLAGMAGS